MAHKAFRTRPGRPLAVVAALALCGTALGQVRGQVAPFRQATWQEMVEQSAAMPARTGLRFAPDHGRVTDRLIPGLTSMVTLPSETWLQLRGSCPGFPGGCSG